MVAHMANLNDGNFSRKNITDSLSYFIGHISMVNDHISILRDTNLKNVSMVVAHMPYKTPLMPRFEGTNTTGEGLINGVGNHMPIQGRLVFTLKRAHLARESLPCLAVTNHVIVQKPFVIGAERANVAKNPLFFLRMCTFMAVNVMLMFTGERAHVTAVRPFLGMCNHVYGKVALVFGAESTHGARVGLVLRVRQHVAV